MYELKDDEFHEMIKHYDDCVLIYYLMKTDCPYQEEASHIEALSFAMDREVEKSIKNINNAEVMFGKELADKLTILTYDITKAKAKRVEAKDLLFVPKLLKKDSLNNTFYDYDYRKLNKGEQIPYWYAFLEPPYGAGSYDPIDFQKVNQLLFPNGEDTLEVYEWTTDWSDCFDAGHEWWGASCWSIYDKSLDRYVVIIASATD